MIAGSSIAGLLYSVVQLVTPSFSEIVGEVEAEEKQNWWRSSFPDCQSRPPSGSFYLRFLE